MYSDWWLQCQSVRRAPCMDSTLYQTLLKYKNMISKIASSALRSLNRHLWCLTEEIVWFAMFAIIDTNVPNNVQQDMAEKHFKLKRNHSSLNIPENRFGKDYGKPRFPSISE